VREGNKTLALGPIWVWKNKGLKVAREENLTSRTVATLEKCLRSGEYRKNREKGAKVPEENKGGKGITMGFAR